MSADAQPDALDVSFPTRRILAIVGDKWTTVVLYCLSIREFIDGIIRSASVVASIRPDHMP